MSALDFPDNPAVGEVYGSSGVLWRWDGSRWGSTSGAAFPQGRIAYAQITATQGGITSAVDIGGLSVTWTADPTRVYRVSMQLEVQSNATNDVIVANMMSPAGTVITRMEIRSVGGWGDTVQAEAIRTGWSGPVTMKVNIGRAVGTGTIAVQAAPEYPSFIMVEDITYQAPAAASPVRPGTYAVAEVNGMSPIPISAWTTLTWAARQVIKDPTVINIEGGNTQFVVKRAGDYLVNYTLFGNCTVIQTSGHYWQTQLLLNGSTAVPLLMNIQSMLSTYSTLSASKIVSLAANSVLTMQLVPSAAGFNLAGDIPGRCYMQVSAL